MIAAAEGAPNPVPIPAEVKRSGAAPAGVSGLRERLEEFLERRPSSDGAVARSLLDEFVSWVEGSPDDGVAAHTCEWLPIPESAPAAPDAAVPPETGRWLVLHDESVHVSSLIEAARSFGLDVSIVSWEAHGAALSWLPEVDVFLRCATERDRVVILRGGGVASGGRPLEAEAPEAVIAGGLSTLELMQRIVRETQQHPVRLTLALSGAVAVDRSEPAPRLGCSLLWGMGKSFALEHPCHWGGMVDFDASLGASCPESTLHALLREISASVDQVALRGSTRLVPRLLRTPLSAETPSALSPDATYLVTGGTGGLGLATARWLSAHGARHIVLASRTGESVDLEDVRRQLEREGTRLHWMRADLSRIGHVRRLLETDLRELPPLRGIVHAAGGSDPCELAAVDSGRFRGVLEPRLCGALWLDQLSRSAPLDFFVMYSSIAAVWGARHGLAYGAANHALEAVAATRRAQGLPASVICWGPWQGSRVPGESAEELDGRAGLRPLASAAALVHLPRALQGRDLVVADVDWSALRSVLPEWRAEFLPEAPEPEAQKVPDLLEEMLGAREQAEQVQVVEPAPVSVPIPVVEAPSLEASSHATDDVEAAIETAVVPEPEALPPIEIAPSRLEQVAALLAAELDSLRAARSAARRSP